LPFEPTSAILMRGAASVGILEDVVDTLIAHPPTDLEQLEAIVGDVHRDVDAFEVEYVVRPMRKPAPALFLLVLDGDLAGRRFRLSKHTPTQIGRVWPARIRPNDPAISRVHAEVRLQKDDVVLLDAGSSGGTRMDDEFIKGEHVLETGDVFVVGQTRVTLVRETPRSDRFTDLVAHLTVSLHFDMYHDNPYRLEGRGLQNYELRFDEGMDRVVALLEAQLGKARQCVRFKGPPPTLCHVFHPFYVTPYKDRSFHLAWFDSVPRWALPDVDADERDRFLWSLREKLLVLPVDADWAKFDQPPQGAGLRIERWNEDRPGRTVVFEPPMSADRLCQLWEWELPVAASHDLHQSSWAIELCVGDAKEGPDTVLDTRQPRFGAWSVDARLAGRPSEKKGLEAGHLAPVYDLVHTDVEVRSVSFEPSER
jgi:hypothetical protein